MWTPWSRSCAAPISVMGGRSHLARGRQVRGLAAERQALQIVEPRRALDVGHGLGRDREQAGELGPSGERELELAPEFDRVLAQRAEEIGMRSVNTALSGSR